MKTKKNKKYIALFSGGLDSRLVLKILQEKYKKKEIIALFFKLPFENKKQGIKKFTKNQKIKLKIIDCTKGKLLQEYLKILKNPKYRTGKSINPCIDCKIFMIKKAKEFSKKYKNPIIVTGEVENQRGLSQTTKALKIISQESKIKVYRPLIKKGITGRQRIKQITLAKKFNIDYPSPAGGCLLCEKILKKRFKVLLNKNLINTKTYKLINKGRHFYFPNLELWTIVGRNENENKILEQFKLKSIKSSKGKPAIYFNISNKKNKKIAKELQKAYSKKSNSKLKNKFEKYKI